MTQIIAQYLSVPSKTVALLKDTKSQLVVAFLIYIFMFVYVYKFKI